MLMRKRIKLPAVFQEADRKLASQIRALEESKKEVTRLTDALLQKT